MDASAPQLAPHYFRNEEAAAYLNLLPRTLEKFRTIGGGPRFRKFGHCVKYTQADLDAWANSRVCESTSDPAYAVRRRRR